MPLSCSRSWTLPCPRHARKPSSDCPAYQAKPSQEAVTASSQLNTQHDPINPIQTRSYRIKPKCDQHDLLRASEHSPLTAGALTSYETALPVRHAARQRDISRIRRSIDITRAQRRTRT